MGAKTLYGSAAEWSAEVSAAHEPRLGLLEAYAALAAPGLLKHLGEDGAVLARQLRQSASSKGSSIAVVAGILIVVMALSPFYGLAFLTTSFTVADNLLPAETALVSTGVACGASVLFTVCWMIAWFASGRKRSSLVPALCGASALAVVALLPLMSRVAADEGVVVAGWVWISVISAGAVSLLFLLVYLVAKTRSSSAEAEHASDTQRLRLDAEWRELSPELRAEILADRDAALGTLVARGLISQEQAGRAKQQPFGSLGA